MPYLIVFTKPDRNNNELTENCVSSVHPLKWLKEKKRLGEIEYSDEIKFLWWTEITEDEAKIYDPDYSTPPGFEYYGQSLR